MGVRRLFIAVYPPSEVARELLRQVHSLIGGKARYTPVEQVHLTLYFIGDTNDRDLPEVEESIMRSLAGLSGFSLAPRCLITLPRRGPARLVAAECPCPPSLAEAHRRLVTRLARPGTSRAGVYLPHITLCRYGSAGGPCVSTDIRQPETLVFAVHEAALMQSTLTPSGAVHTPLRRFPFSGE
jgi:2'-5' RNA ligase